MAHEMQEELETNIGGFEVRLAAARDGLATAQREFATWDQRIRTTIRYDQA